MNITFVKMENASENYSCSTLVPTENPKEFDVRVFNVVINFILLLVGVPGNCLIIRVYWAKKVKTSTHVLIMSLAWVDLIACLMSVVDIVPQFLQLARVESPAVFTLLLTLRKMIVSSSVLITGVIAADRYLCVCRPQSRFFTHRRAKIAAWSSFVFAVIVNSPGIVALYVDQKKSMIWIFMLIIFQIICFLTSVLTILFCYTQVYRVIRKHVRGGNKKVSAVVNSTDSSNRRNESTTSGIAKDKCPATPSDRVSFTHHSDVVKIRQQQPPADFSSEGIQSEKVQERTAEECTASRNNTDTLQNTTLGRDLGTGTGRKKSKPSTFRRSPSTHSLVLQRKTTKMLFITSLVFLITWLPYWIMIAVIISSRTGGSDISPTVLVAVEELSLTLLINNAVNPFIYGLANRRFRRDCRMVLNNMKLC
ncbi:muscarinic acetylcholine receptor M1-like [Asterias rubens]|uniref:muscarinic acetylcholine receptor M1-like n=1 Tax=Asterias rubens TaxID=7604 RepID=UPI001455C681|nr:muscarinic acetylcholine receptor M1-like [Asterias rubens]